MQPHLSEVIKSARIARNAVLKTIGTDASTVEKQTVIKAANSVAANNHSIIMAHALDLRIQALGDPDPPAIDGSPGATAA